MPRPKRKIYDSKLTTLPEGYQDKMCSLTVLGLTQREVAQFFNISVEALEDLFGRYPEFHERYKQAPLKGDTQVKRIAYTMATSGKNPAMTAFWLKTKCGWRENVRVEHVTDAGESSNEFANMPKSDRNKEIDKLLKFRGKQKDELTEEQLDDFKKAKQIATS